MATKRNPNHPGNPRQPRDARGHFIPADRLDLHEAAVEADMRAQEHAARMVGCYPDENQDDIRDAMRARYAVDANQPPRVLVYGTVALAVLCSLVGAFCWLAQGH